MTGRPQVLALYHPRFHQIPENDAWYGDGFTEWTMVAGTRPSYPGHRQPDLPADLGFYDLRVPQTRVAQAALAGEYGISGFVYLHYWFHGRELFGAPQHDMLASGSPNFPFALCWANERWKRVRLAAASDSLLEQSYDEDDDKAHILRLIESFEDPRYIRVDGRPLLMVSSPHLWPEPTRTAELWREQCRRAGVPAPWLVMGDQGHDPADIGFDAAVQSLPPTPGADGRAAYKDMATRALEGDAPAWVRYPTVAPGSDSTPLHPDGGAVIWTDSTPERFGQWLAAALDGQKKRAGGTGIVMVNSWNDWANGSHLEPDIHWGRGYLQATREVVERGAGKKLTAPHQPGPAVARDAEQRYADLYQQYRDLEASTSGFLSYANRRLRVTEERLENDLATSRAESRRLAAALEPLEDLLTMQTKRSDELEMLLTARPPLPAVVRAPTTGLATDDAAGRTRYLELLKGCLTRLLFMNDEPDRDPHELARQRAVRLIGQDWPEEAETMIGMLRLDCIQECVETVIREDIPGDFLEAGVWRGGATIFMKGILAAHGVHDRRVWVADSFRGLPVPDEVNFPQDVPEDLSSFDELAVSQEQVRANFARYDLLDDQVRFLEGWFKDTLPSAPVDTLAVLRLDGDYYESTIQILESLYHKVSPGGFVIVDDYGCIEACRQAVTDFRAANDIDDAIVEVDWTGVYWRRSDA